MLEAIEMFLGFSRLAGALQGLRQAEFGGDLKRIQRESAFWNAAMALSYCCCCEYMRPRKYCVSASSGSSAATFWKSAMAASALPAAFSSRPRLNHAQGLCGSTLGGFLEDAGALRRSAAYSGRRCRC